MSKVTDRLLRLEAECYLKALHDAGFSDQFFTPGQAARILRNAEERLDIILEPEDVKHGQLRQILIPEDYALKDRVSVIRIPEF